MENSTVGAVCPGIYTWLKRTESLNHWATGKVPFDTLWNPKESSEQYRPWATWGVGSGSQVASRTRSFCQRQFDPPAAQITLRVTSCWDPCQPTNQGLPELWNGCWQSCQEHASEPFLECRARALLPADGAPYPQGAGRSVGAPHGASPQSRALRWLRDCLPTQGNKSHPKPLFKEQASGLALKPLEIPDKSLFCFYLRMNSPIGSFQKKTSTSSIIRLGWLFVMLGDSRFRFRDSWKSANSWILPEKWKKRHRARGSRIHLPSDLMASQLQ